MPLNLVLAIVHSDDASGLLDFLTKKGFRATRINTAGGFLKESNATILLGVEDELHPRDFPLATGRS